MGFTHSDGSTSSLYLPDLEGSLTDSQTLTILPLDKNNKVIFGLSNSASQTLDLSALANVEIKKQTLSVSGLSEDNLVFFSLSDANTQILDLSALASRTLMTNQTLRVSALDSSNKVHLSISGGNTQTLDLSSLVNQEETALLSPILLFSPLSADYTVYLSVSGSDSQTLDLSVLSKKSPFNTQNNLTTNASGTQSLDDFVFGAIGIDNKTGPEDDARIIFDKSKAAFRAGYVSGNSWNESNLGRQSFASGYRTQASGHRSTALGNTAEAHSYAETALGSYNTIISPRSKASWHSEDRLLVVGNGSSSARKSDALVILKNGNIGIGDSTPTEATLVVSGTIMASGSITSKASTIPDYVFEYYFTGRSIDNPKYIFPSLKEVEHFIQKNHHLPNIPGADQISKQGESY